MSNAILLALLAIAILVIWYLLVNRNKPRTWQTQGKQENKEKVLALFARQEAVSNNDVEKLLGVSDATATRYLSELEREGRVQQIGTTGRGVEYKIK
jgi:Fic family protein